MQRVTAPIALPDLPRLETQDVDRLRPTMTTGQHGFPHQG